jgi:hypothetical protein
MLSEIHFLLPTSVGTVLSSVPYEISIDFQSCHPMLYIRTLGISNSQLRHSIDREF